MYLICNDVSLASVVPENMARVSRCSRKGALDFAQKIYNQYQLQYLDQGFKSALQTGYVGFDENLRKSGKTVNKYDRKPRMYSLFNKSQRLRNATFGGRSISSIYGRHIWAQGLFVFVREYGGNGQRAETLYKTKTGYYDVLGVSSSATQAQIKTAYYKQSFIYHPDRNSGSEEATIRFSDINEAYTVLGNKVLRRKYDRGLLGLHDLTAGQTEKPPSREETVRASTIIQPRKNRTAIDKILSPDIYDLDQFMKSHYSDQLRKEKDTRARRQEELKEKEQNKKGGKLGNGSEIYFGVIFLAWVILISCKE